MLVTQMGLYAACAEKQKVAEERSNGHLGCPGGDAELKSLGKVIKQRIGTGGSVKNGQIVIQGDHVDTVLIFLKAQGFYAKKTGG